METFNKKRMQRHQKSKVLAGLVILTFGILFLLMRLGFEIPFWIFSWKVILITIGVVALYKHKFKHFGGYALIAVGGVFLINDFYPGTIDSSLLLPVIIIAFGLMMVAKSLNLFSDNKKSKRNKHVIFDGDMDITSEDFIESTTFFGGTSKNIVSKNFTGGEFITAFGGTEINLSQADMQKPAVLQATTAFGGIELIIPSNWQVKSEITTIFGSVEYKRSIISDAMVDESKTLILKGTCVFGGVEIQSY